MTPFYRYAKLNQLHFSHFLFSDNIRFNSYDEFLAGLADYEIKTTQKFVVTKSFKEYGKIIFLICLLGWIVLFSIYNFFRSRYSHENSGLAVKLVKFFGEPMNIRTQFSNINF